MAIQTRNGNDEWETYPSNGTQTANFAYYFTIGDEAGIRLVTTGGSSIDLWAQVSAGIDQ